MKEKEVKELLEGKWSVAAFDPNATAADDDENVSGCKNEVSIIEPTAEASISQDNYQAEAMSGSRLSVMQSTQSLSQYTDEESITNTTAEVFSTPQGYYQAEATLDPRLFVMQSTHMPSQHTGRYGMASSQNLLNMGVHQNLPSGYEGIIPGRLQYNEALSGHLLSDSADSSGGALLSNVLMSQHNLNVPPQFQSYALWGTHQQDPAMQTHSQGNTSHGRNLTNAFQLTQGMSPFHGQIYHGTVDIIPHRFLSNTQQGVSNYRNAFQLAGSNMQHSHVPSTTGGSMLQYYHTGRDYRPRSSQLQTGSGNDRTVGLQSSDSHQGAQIRYNTVPSNMQTPSHGQNFSAPLLINKASATVSSARSTEPLWQSSVHPSPTMGPSGTYNLTDQYVQVGSHHTGQAAMSSHPAEANPETSTSDGISLQLGSSKDTMQPSIRSHPSSTPNTQKTATKSPRDRSGSALQKSPYTRVPVQRLEKMQPPASHSSQQYVSTDQSGSALQKSPYTRVPGQRLAKMMPSASHSSQQYVSTDHIRAEDPLPKLVGHKCQLCNIDLGLEPNGSRSSYQNLPKCAILPCGHCYHNDCLVGIFGSPERGQDPPCFLCSEDKAPSNR
ncbi:uncharacterized protein [Typha latifolia]|uniref:uncharacterized protein n=1 Tax=Typha latifolia TaxID=4733 RepID=UPI003C2FE7DC